MMITTITFIAALVCLYGLFKIVSGRTVNDKIGGYILSGISAVIFSLIIMIIKNNVLYLAVSIAWCIQLYITSEYMKSAGDRK